MQKLQDKIYVALQHEIQKKHSAEDKLSKVVAQQTQPGVQGVSEQGDVAVSQLMSHTWAIWRARPQTCQRRISPWLWISVEVQAEPVLCC